jgi:DNA mismatch repair protein MutL
MIMNRIRVLPSEIAQKIAAGEVIERPVSVVKELVENSLDAGGTEIRVDLLDGGKKLIRVLDDGQGMSQEDAALCFRRHSTSKISTEEDLDRIATLGFRGEALASISSVSRLTLKSFDGSGDRGTEIEREGEKLLAIRDVAFPRGTSIEVRDLFFNLPARRKFLRSDRSELNVIAKYLTNAALAFPGVRFLLAHGGREILDVPAVAGLRERVFQLFGKTLLDGLMDVDFSEGECRIAGLASKPLKGRGDRNHQYFFVNTRPVKDRMLQAALNQAYSGILEKDRSAEAFLFLTVPYSEVDVNVHPAKAEVRFRDSQSVFRTVLKSIEHAALRASAIKEIREESRDQSYASRLDGGPAPESGQGILPPLFGKKRPEAGIRGGLDEGGENGVPAAGRTGSVVLGQYLDMYIVAVSDEGLLIIDQHNAHERILYEKYAEVDRKGDWPRKMLLIPVILDLSPSESLAYEESRPLFEAAGFVVEGMGGRSYALKEFPDIFGEDEARDVFMRLLEEVRGEKPVSRREKLLATMACKSAIKAGEPLPAAKMEFLVAELFKTSQPSLCPHGRPVVVRIDRAVIDKGLGRK